RAPAHLWRDPFLATGAFASTAVGDTTHDDLHESERALADHVGAAQRAAFIAGRRALRAAITSVQPEHAQTPLLRSARGAPLVPEGLTGSISHKRTRAIAVAANTTDGLVGVDLEERPTERDIHRPSLATRILTSYEQDRIATSDPLAHREATLVHFAIKEAVYKAIDPYVHRYVRFTEVELDLHNDGTATVRLFLPELEHAPVVVSAIWRLEDTWIIAAAKSR
ncbi:MAG: 4'-phosphopantetheinyl transferase superfamily protein, partial [Gemmatimonadaceae bacterium]|nr:4'-phosphopantetheinyl transferase superfamily protein [Gemmatimonadaceae bacterium]